MWERETPAPTPPWVRMSQDAKDYKLKDCKETKIEIKKRPEIERVYEDDSWVIDLIDGKVRVSYFEDYHFVDDIVISKDTFKE